MHNALCNCVALKKKFFIRTSCALTGPKVAKAHLTCTFMWHLDRNKLVAFMMNLEVGYSPAESRPEGGPSSAFPDPLIFLNNTKC